MATQTNHPRAAFLDAVGQGAAAEIELEAAQLDVARTASEYRGAVEYFAYTRDTRDAGEYREEMAEILRALIRWDRASEAYLLAMREVVRQRLRGLVQEHIRDRHPEDLGRV